MAVRTVGKVLRACDQNPVCLACAWGPCPAWTCPCTPLHCWAAVLADMFAWLQLWYNMTLLTCLPVVAAPPGWAGSVCACWEACDPLLRMSHLPLPGLAAKTCAAGSLAAGR